MFYSLPAETVFEAKERTKRATFYFFILLVLLYVFFVDLLALVASFWVVNWYWSQVRSKSDTLFFDPLPVIAIASFVAVLLAVLHFISARSKTLDELLGSLGAEPADPKDRYHQNFINVVGEIEQATGIHGIRAVTIPHKGCNAFSLQDGQGQCAIGVTEGLLSRLTRPELSAVVAHEAAHLVHEDSRLVTTACFLFGIFGSTNEMLGKTMNVGVYTYDRRSSSRDGGILAVSTVLWIISTIGYFVTKLVFMTISREREYLADADGVAMCKDPLGLAEALYKISRRDRGQVPPNYSALFIMNPEDSSLDEQEGALADIFSDHPPVSQRLTKLLNWAKSDLPTLENLVDREGGQDPSVPAETTAQTPTNGPVSKVVPDPKAALAPTAIPAPAATYMAYQDNQWKGPYSTAQMLSMGFLSPAAWICPFGTQAVQKVSEIPELRPLLAASVKGPAGPNACPRCKIPLLTLDLDGTEIQECGSCKGHLLRGGVLERLITREGTSYDPAAIQKARTWRDSQHGPLKDRDAFPEIHCPLCGDIMGKGIHTMLTQVVIDHCTNDDCGAIWCDGGELETIRMIIQDAHAAPTPKT